MGYMARARLAFAAGPSTFFVAWGEVTLPLVAVAVLVNEPLLMSAWTPAWVAVPVIVPLGASVAPTGWMHTMEPASAKRSVTLNGPVSVTLPLLVMVKV